MTHDQSILYLDIETVPMEGLVDQSNEEFCHLWEDKIGKMQKNNPDQEEMDEEEKIHAAGLYAEFGRIACISYGAFYTDKDTGEDRFCVSSVYGTNEKEMLEKFANMLRLKSSRYTKICGHNAKEFDVPYIARRMMINKIQVPPVLKVYDKKPWEMPIIDTMELWKCGSYRYNAQLKLLCAVFGIPTPKDDIDGSEVAGVFYKEKNYERIATYCEKDVVATMQVHLNITGYDSIDESKITKVHTDAIV